VSLERLPYPEQQELLEEIAADLDGCYRELRARGLSEDAASAEAQRRFVPDADTAAALAALHVPRLRQGLERLSPRRRDWLEALALALPLAGVLVFVGKEVPMVTFLLEGGFMIPVILVTGGFALVLLGRRAVLWFVLRDHSPSSLAGNSATPLYLAAVLVLLGLLGTALDYYVVLTRYAAGRFGAEDLKVGLYEPLPCLIVAISLAVVVVLLHGGMQAALRARRIPAQ
jgi:hypothetical protein